MCYSFTPVGDPDTGRITWIPPKVLMQLEREGKVWRIDPVFPGDPAEIWRWTKNGIEPVQARFDLVPRFFKTGLSRAEMLKEKESRRKGSAGFSSYNARSDGLLLKPTWKGPWRERKRMVVPVAGFFERPNEDDAPREFRGRRYFIRLDSPMNLAGLYDRWENDKGETLESFGIITVASDGNPLLQSIHHPRCPLILDHDQVERWLDPGTTPEEAMRMVKLHPAEGMTVSEMAPEDPKGQDNRKKRGGPGPVEAGGQLSLF